MARAKGTSMRPTLFDVATEAGVSATTVSRVLNNRGSLSEKTRLKVFQAVRETGYHPNQSARTLWGKRSKLTGLIFPTTQNPFYGDMVYELERELFKRGYKTLLCNSSEDSEQERQFLDLLLANQADGMIVGSHNLDIRAYQQSDLPVVSIDRVTNHTIPVVSSDNYQGGRMATEELWKRGARMIGHINSAEVVEAPYSYERRRGYEDVVMEKGLEPTVFRVDWALAWEEKVPFLLRILEDNPTLDGLFIADDMTASLMMTMCRERHKHIAIVGYDGSDTVRKYIPDLPTIVQPIHDMAKTAVDVLIREINGDFSVSGSRFRLPVSFLPERRFS
ncbi:LacI family DNA-binding transcriptional regulator [Bifidobacterium crudilactis]|jgi:LacI family sucrose operon transcriptional repressor|uniref:LacI family DNA-binding transcriptional regulator n=1 Tax=Bifidobacterium crudilactis TaxID=327277 RepID=UPI001930B55E|nr:LacI family DNA-binding transcriptional regulator [Bifidobacterium crudilactis]MCI2149248.1 LacI family DNA-binding transcriptional regulator [Bifidobacterium crudilactis]MCI2157300.1 LacI family DNA-binding transcriptional regulator [Bifidobacterium crudilactis]